METYPCLGLELLGKCSYNPANPIIAYFDIGGAIAALAIILAVEQLAKPIYLFRLHSYGVQFWHLAVCVLFGVFAVLFAVLLPNLPVPRNVTFAYPVVWELIGAALITFAYASAAFLILRPARVGDFNLVTFARAAAALLAEAKDDDRAKFAQDLQHNIERLFEYARAWEIAEGHATALEFERLREIGAPLEIRGQPPISAFYLFTHRRALEKADFARSLLRLMADRHFCSALVSDCPWQTAQLIVQIGHKRLHVRDAAPFVQEIARQAILHENSIMAREVGYDGFAAAPVLSESLFSDPFILRSYEPLDKLTFDGELMITRGSLTRLAKASRLMLDTALEHHGYWGSYYMWDVEQAYEGVSRQIGWDSKQEYSSKAISEWHFGIRALYEGLTEGFEELDRKIELPLFIADSGKNRNDLVHVIASIVFESIAAVANSFSGIDSRFWHYTIDTFHDIFPFHTSQPVGFNPLQQHLACQLIEKLSDNMNGYYPSVSKVLLAVVGPYQKAGTAAEDTAYVMLKNMMYRELKKLPDLYARKPEKITDFLPTNVVYDPYTNCLTHTYSGGTTQITNLSNLEIPEVKIFDQSTWRLN